MIRAAKLVVSRPMYAFNPNSWGPAWNWHSGFEVEAVWFKRKHGRTVAVSGTYHPKVLRPGDEPTDDDYSSWIAAADDNRYGGSWAAQWDGESLLTYERKTPDEQAFMVEFLAPMLLGFPEVPAGGRDCGWDGWWTFEKARR